MATSTLAFSDLADSANKFMTGQAIAPYLANLPNFANMVGSRTENITQQLKGQLPQDVINQIGQQAAERGIATGSPGSPNTNAAYLRALGLNSLQMQQQGNQNLSGAIADTPVPQLFNPMSLIVPQMNAAQEMNAARLGQFQAQPKNQWGAQTASVSGPAGGIPHMAGSPSNPWGGTATVSGPSWGTPQAQGPSAYSPYGSPSQMPAYGGTADFDPLSYTYATGGQYGGSVDWNSLYSDPNMPAGWADQDWGGPFNQIDASNPDNAFMFE